MTAFEQRWRVPVDHPAFAGHFPGNPIVPGVVLLDHVLIAALMHLGGEEAAWRISQIKFLSPCGPGDELVFTFVPAARGSLSFQVRCDEREVASGQLQSGVA